MGAALNSTYANGLSGALAAYANATNDDAVQLIVNMPKELWLAVIYFAAYEIWQCNALALLNSVSVQQASVWSNLEDDSCLGCSATVSGSGASVSTLTSQAFWWPTDASGKIISDYKAAAGGTMKVIRYDGSIYVVATQVVGYPNYQKTLQEAPSSPPTPPPGYSSGYDVPV
jgi:hypothetical protein